MSEAATDLRAAAAEAGRKIEGLQAEREELGALHGEALQEALREATDERDKRRVLAEEMSSYVAGIKEELEVSEASSSPLPMA